LSHVSALAASGGRTHPRMGPPHLYLGINPADTPTVDGMPGKLFKCVVWFDMDALFATFRAVILFCKLLVYIGLFVFIL
jgi:hypothetical protein